MNPDLARLHPYPFERLAALLHGVQPAELPPILLSIGEPKHPAPPFVLAERAAARRLLLAVLVMVFSLTGAVVYGVRGA